MNTVTPNGELKNVLDGLPENTVTPNGELKKALDGIPEGAEYYNWFIDLIHCVTEVTDQAMIMGDVQLFYNCMSFATDMLDTYVNFAAHVVSGVVKASGEPLETLRDRCMTDSETDRCADRIMALMAERGWSGDWIKTEKAGEEGEASLQ